MIKSMAASPVIVQCHHGPPVSVESVSKGDGH